MHHLDAYMGIKCHSLNYHLDFPLIFFLPHYSGKILEMHFNTFSVILMLVEFNWSKANDVLRMYLLYPNLFDLGF